MLGGEPAGQQVDLVDRFVSVAVRPVELDLLSGITLRALLSMWRTMKIVEPDT